ncbi:hypothetical protein NMG60_11022952 [Bertholletia excelsa]
MLGSGMNLITTVIGFGMSAAFIVFVCTRLICGRLRGADSRRMLEFESRIDLEQPGNQNNGLPPVVIAAIPTLMFNHAAFTSMEDALCTICLGEYQENEVLRIIPKCCHTFHLSCVDVWLRNQSTCPVCRLPLKNSVEAKQAITATFAMTLQPGSPETLIEYSQQQLLTGTELSERNVSSTLGDAETVQ